MAQGKYNHNKDYTCKICGVVSKGWGAHQRHLGQTHDIGPSSPSARKRAIATAFGKGGEKEKVKRNTQLLKRSLPKIVSAPRQSGASYDQSVPWNLGLVDALNMARKSIERSLEIIEGSKGL
jgi:hypothetical protein